MIILPAKKFYFTGKAMVKEIVSKYNLIALFNVRELHCLTKELVPDIFY